MKELLAVYERELSAYSEFHAQAVSAAEKAEAKSEMLEALEKVLSLEGITRTHARLPTFKSVKVQTESSGVRGYRRYWNDVVQWICDQPSTVSLTAIAQHIKAVYDDEMIHVRLYQSIDRQVRAGKLRRIDGNYWKPAEQDVEALSGGTLTYSEER